ncbi:MAG: maleylacetoacetate isomerase [Moraxellaceae bacterium]|nr:MAG: maleylacetoacetate isomerase [Moraxellaceae bacterium]
MLTLYDYFRSSASYRVRIALNLKGVAYEKSQVHLVNNGGEQNSQRYRRINPQGLVPSIEEAGHNEPFILHQSLAIIEYLDEKYPTPNLMPEDLQAKSLVRSFAYKICCDIHPLNNLRVLNYLENDLGIEEEQKLQWYDHWVEEGLLALEAQLKTIRPLKFCFGDTPSIADLCLIPQVYNAKRFHIDLSEYKRIVSVYDRCMDLEAFYNARPEETTS